LVNTYKMKTGEKGVQSIMSSAEMFAFILVDCLSDAVISRVYIRCSTTTGGMDMGITRERAVDVRGGFTRARTIDAANATTAIEVLEMNVKQ